MSKQQPRTGRSPEGPASDVDLMLTFQRGDDRAFAELVGRHQKSVLNLVRRFVGPMADSEDLAQEVFVRLFQARRNYRPAAKFTTYLYRNTLNLCLNYLRDRRHRRFASIDAAARDDGSCPEFEDARAAAPQSELADAERAAAVRKAIESLPESQRTAVVLLRWQEMSYQEIADTMDLSVMAVKSLLSRAKESLKLRLSFLLKDDEAARKVREEGPGR